MDELRKVAIRILNGNQLAAVVVVIPGNGHAVAVFDGGDKVREAGIIVIIPVGDVSSGVAIHQLENLKEVAGILIVNILNGRETVRATIGIVDGGNAAPGVPVKADSPADAIGILMINAVGADDDGVAGTLDNLRQHGRAINPGVNVRSRIVRIRIRHAIRGASRDVILCSVGLGGENPAGEILVFNGGIDSFHIGIIWILPIRGRREEINRGRGRVKGSQRGMNPGGRRPCGRAGIKTRGHGKGKNGLLSVWEGERDIPAAASADADHLWQTVGGAVIVGEGCLIAANGHILPYALNSMNVQLDETRQDVTIGSDQDVYKRQPLNGPVWAITSLNGNLVVGGQFTDAGGNTNANLIAELVGGNWENLGNGLGGEDWFVDEDGNPYTNCNCEVLSLATSGTNLFVGGDFTSAGDQTNANSIAIWNGLHWKALGLSLIHI